MNLKKYLKEKDISLLKLSKECNIPYSTLASAVEKPESMRVENLVKISKYLNLTLDEMYKIFTEKNEKTLGDILKEQKEMKLKGNIYHYTQIKFTDNTNRIEGSKLTEEETRFIFETYLEIKDYCKKIDISVSQFIREIAIKKVRESEDMNLLKFINQNCGFVSIEEQKEIEAFMKNYNRDEGEFVEVSLDDILQG